MTGDKDRSIGILPHQDSIFNPLAMITVRLQARSSTVVCARLRVYAWSLTRWTPSSYRILGPMSLHLFRGEITVTHLYDHL